MGNSKGEDRSVWRKVVDNCWLYCLICLCSPCLCVLARGFSKKAKRKRRQRNHTGYLDYLTSPLPRRRALTLPLDGAPLQCKIQDPATREEPQSLFFGILSREIRDRIYYEILGGETFRIRRESLSRIRAKRGLYDQLEKPEDQHSSERQTAVKPTKRLSILSTSRVIYSEAVSILYSGNTYQLKDGMKPAFRSLFDFQYVLLPQRFAAMRDLEIPIHLGDSLEQCFYYWQWDRPDDRILPPSNNMWDILDTMKCLRRLRLDINCELVDQNLKSEAQSAEGAFFVTEEELLKPAMKLDWIPDFEIKVSWPANKDSERVLRNAPFRLSRSCDDYLNDQLLWMQGFQDMSY